MAEYLFPKTSYLYLFLFGFHAFYTFPKRSRVIVTNWYTVVFIFEEVK